MSIRLSFIGFRHAHITALYRLARQRGDIEIVAACEEDAATRNALRGGDIEITHDRYASMLRDIDFNVAACGDYYSIRAERLLQAIEAGKHVLGDKPLCARLEELGQIEQAASSRNLCVGCMLDLPDFAPYQTLHAIVRGGRIGEVHTVSFAGQHPLFYGTRPQWYFEEGKHLGTLNDIAVHGIDLIPWITGRRIVEITAARAWNAKAKMAPFFQDGAQAMFRLDNDGGVFGDVSYLNPDSHGYGLPSYWRIAIHGTEGYAETAINDTAVRLFRDGEAACEIPVGEPRTGGYLDDFLAEIAGKPNYDGLHKARVFRSTRTALLTQQAADTGNFPVALCEEAL